LLGPIIIALICAALLTLTNALTGERIDANYSAREHRQLLELLGSQVSLEMLTSASWQDSQLDFCTAGSAVTRFETSGYAGPIAGLLAWQPRQQRITGIRITAHLETPGIADFLNDQGDDSWLHALQQLTTPQIELLDTVSGATISSAAVKRGAISVLNGAEQAIERCAE
jgi:Na+-translocating ferredoxin:NAD+ oxidoreductase RnfG subunit